MRNILVILGISTPILFGQLALSQINRSWFKTDEEIDKSRGVDSDRGSAAQHRALLSIRDRVSQTSSVTNEEAIEYFGKVLRKLAKPNIYQVRERIEVYDLVQSKLLAIPGHAEYYADKLAEARKNSEKPWVDNKYQMFHQQIRETMVHLPSPETIWVVGNMLESKEDMRTSEEYSAIREEQKSKGMQGLLLPNPRKFAYTVLLKVGLRDYEESMHHKNSASCLAWWKEVKSGQRTFSFKGQAVEYRFNTDGTWQTIPIANPPDDAPKPPVFEKSEPTPERQEKEIEKPSEPKKPIWSWIVTTVLLLGGILLWFVMKSRSAKRNV